MDQSKDNASRPADRISRAELMIVLSCFAAGFAVRLVNIDRASIEHFDEGVYASNVWFQDLGGAGYPARHLYAPPLMPAMIEWSIRIFGPSGIASLLPGVIFGCGTVMLTWHVARQWFGPEAGVAAVTLAALSDFHSVYSRTALTDAPLSFLVLLAVYAFERTLRTGALPAVLTAGVTTGLAWWTKYNGWLPLAIAASAGCAWLLFSRPRDQRPAVVLGRWIEVSLIAAAVWSPVVFGLRNSGGYGAVAENHRGYLVGLSGWMSAASTQFMNHRALDGWLSVISPAVAVILCGPVLARFDKRFTWNDASSGIPPIALSRPLMCGLILSFGALLSATGVVLGMLTLMAIPAILRWPMPRTGSHERRDSSLACWLTAAWIIGLSVATPFYYPYPRLTLPWLIASWIGGGALLGWWAGATRRQWQRTQSSSEDRDAPIPALRLVMACLVMALGLIFSRQRVRTLEAPSLEDRNQIKLIAEQIAAECRKTEVPPQPGQPAADPVVLIYADPAMFFQLRALGVSAFPAGGLQFAGVGQALPEADVFLVAGPHATRSDEFRNQWVQYQFAFEPVAVYDYAPSDFVQLNNIGAPIRNSDGSRVVDKISLYSLRRNRPAAP